MKTEVGLWIDHRQAVIVTLVDQEEEIKRITSNMEKHVRYSGASHANGASESHNDTTENGRDRRFDDQLNRYYDEVIACVCDADSILILGPGEAKVELQKQLEGQALGERIVGIETTDKMTDGQIAAKVRQHFRG
jgi:stalled ribosome rescue protein Dom34